MTKTKLNSEKKQIEDLLPILPLETIQDAERKELQNWAIEMLRFYPIGAIHDMSDWGITLQITSSNSARCIRVVDHEWCLFRLQQINTTFKAAGLKLKIDPIAILQPFEENEEEDNSTQKSINPSENLLIEVV